MPVLPEGDRASASPTLRVPGALGVFVLWGNREDIFAAGRNHPLVKNHFHRRADHDRTCSVVRFHQCRKPLMGSDWIEVKL